MPANAPRRQVIGRAFSSQALRLALIQLPSMINPVPSVPVYVCGEAYSNGQGWVEGALETAEMVLQKHFGLAAPDWASA
ncbi:MAG: hypothetical protein M3065_19710 [Actinomycetota bacterium]|nr:hypothetical protein [Actinomycetota bacterium]